MIEKLIQYLYPVYSILMDEISLGPEVQAVPDGASTEEVSKE